MFIASLLVLPRYKVVIIPKLLLLLIQTHQNVQHLIIGCFFSNELFVELLVSLIRLLHILQLFKTVLQFLYQFVLVRGQGGF
jgi:hypothetical protein